MQVELNERLWHIGEKRHELLHYRSYEILARLGRFVPKIEVVIQYEDIRIATFFAEALYEGRAAL